MSQANDLDESPKSDTAYVSAVEPGQRSWSSGEGCRDRRVGLGGSTSHFEGSQQHSFPSRFFWAMGHYLPLPAANRSTRHASPTRCRGQFGIVSRQRLARTQMALWGATRETPEGTPFIIESIRPLILEARGAGDYSIHSREATQCRSFVCA